MENLIDKILKSEDILIQEEIKNINKEQENAAEEILNIIVDIMQEDGRLMKLIILNFYNLDQYSIIYIGKSQLTQSISFELFIDVLKNQLGFSIAERQQNYVFVTQKNTYTILLKSLLNEIQRKKKYKLNSLKCGKAPKISKQAFKNQSQKQKIIKQNKFKFSDLPKNLQFSFQIPKTYTDDKNIIKQKDNYFSKLELGSSIDQPGKIFSQIVAESRITNRKIFGKQCFVFTNYYLQSQKRKQLVWSEFLYEIALQHSKDMALQKVPFGHQGFQDRFNQISSKFGTARENVAQYSSMFTQISKDVVEGWINSPGHYANIIADNYCSAVAAYYSTHNDCYYFTQLFAKQVYIKLNQQQSFLSMICHSTITFFYY